MRTYFKTETEEHSIGRSLNEGTGLVSEKMESLHAEINERVEAATSSFLQQANFYNIFILCLWLFVNFPSHIFSLIPFYVTVASYCYYEKVRRMMRTAIVSYLLKYFYSFSAAELNNIESEDKVFA